MEQKKEWKDMTVWDAEKFWQHLETMYPEINCQLSNRAFVNTAVVSFQPARMKNEDYDTYNRILSKWLSDNYFMEKQSDLVYVATDDSKGMALDTSLITTIESTGENLTKVVIKEGEFFNTITIKEDAKLFKNRVYIFYED